MHQKHNRTVKVDKATLIARIEENKLNHIKEYEEAVVAYKIEALKQLKEAKKKVEDGDLHINIRLTTPVNRADEYNKIIEMFKWELENFVELDQSEFNEYVHDENESARSAKMSNSYYISKGL